MCRRAEEPAAGQWTLPSGYLECGETLQAGAARETFEETGVKINPEHLDLSSVMNLPEIEEVVITFRSELSQAPILRPGPESLEVQFLSEGEIATKEFAWRRYLGDGPRQFFEQLRAGAVSIKLINVALKDAVDPYQAREYSINPKTRPSALVK